MHSGHSVGSVGSFPSQGNRETHHFRISSESPPRVTQTIEQVQLPRGAAHHLHKNISMTLCLEGECTEGLYPKEGDKSKKPYAMWVGVAKDGHRQ